MCSALEVIPNGPQTQLMNGARCNCLVMSTVRDLEDGCYTNKITIILRRGRTNPDQWH